MHSYINEFNVYMRCSDSPKLDNNSTSHVISSILTTLIGTFTELLPDDWLHIGATDLDSEGTFRWASDNSPLLHTNFNAGEPYGGTNENCALLGSFDLGWLDSICSISRKYMCEYSDV